MDNTINHSICQFKFLKSTPNSPLTIIENCLHKWDSHRQFLLILNFCFVCSELCARKTLFWLGPPHTNMKYLVSYKINTKSLSLHRYLSLYHHVDYSFTLAFNSVMSCICMFVSCRSIPHPLFDYTGVLWPASGMHGVCHWTICGSGSPALLEDIPHIQG